MQKKATCPDYCKGAKSQKTGIFQKKGRRTSGATRFFAGAFVAGILSFSSIFAKEPLAEKMENAQNANLAPITIVMENHAIKSHREAVFRLACEFGKQRIFFELLHPSYQAQINQYLASENDTLPSGLGHIFYLHSREEGATWQDNSYSRLARACKENNIGMTGMLHIENILPTFERIALQDSVYANYIYATYCKDSVPSAVLAGALHGEGIKKWLSKLGLESRTVMLWDKKENSQQAKREHFFEATKKFAEDVELPIDALSLGKGLYRILAKIPMDYLLVLDSCNFEDMPMPPLEPKNDGAARIRQAKNK